MSRIEICRALRAAASGSSWAGRAASASAKAVAPSAMNDSTRSSLLAK